MKLTTAFQQKRLRKFNHLVENYGQIMTLKKHSRRLQINEKSVVKKKDTTFEDLWEISLGLKEPDLDFFF